MGNGAVLRHQYSRPSSTPQTDPDSRHSTIRPAGEELGRGYSQPEYYLNVNCCRDAQWLFTLVRGLKSPLPHCLNGLFVKPHPKPLNDSNTLRCNGAVRFDFHVRAVLTVTITCCPPCMAIPSSGGRSKNRLSETAFASWSKS